MEKILSLINMLQIFQKVYLLLVWLRLSLKVLHCIMTWFVLCYCILLPQLFHHGLKEFCNVNFARATAFIFDTLTDVLVKLSKFCRKKMSLPVGDSNPPPSYSCRMLQPLELPGPDIWCRMFLAATKQLYEWFSPSVRPSVCLSVRHTFLTMFPSSYHHEINFRELLLMTEMMFMQMFKVMGQRSRSQWS